MCRLSITRRSASRAGLSTTGARPGSGYARTITPTLRQVATIGVRIIPRVVPLPTQFEGIPSSPAPVVVLPAHPLAVTSGTRSVNRICVQVARPRIAGSLGRSLPVSTVRSKRELAPQSTEAVTTAQIAWAFTPGSRGKLALVRHMSNVLSRLGAIMCNRRLVQWQQRLCWQAGDLKSDRALSFLFHA